MSKWLRSKKDGYIYPHTPHLAKREDMEPCDGPEPKPVPQPGDADFIGPVKPEITTTDTIAVEPDAMDLSSMHWTKLKKMVEDAGGIWQGKTAALEYLGNVG